MLSWCKLLFYLTFPLTTLAVTSSVGAQSITPDTTLGNENSVVTRDVLIRGIPSDRIDGGATRGNNLFHSFRDFNVDAGRGAYFSNPAGIENIISRVTGSNVSNILGTLGVLGNANLFFANPNGVVFGPNARLDVSGSFFATTSDSFIFDNGFEFSASNPQAPPLLTINIPIGLRFRDNPGSIINQSIAQDANNNTVGLIFGSGIGSNAILALVGGEVNFEGGGIFAPGARVEIGGLSTEGIVGINDDLSLSFPEDVARADVSFNNAAFVDVRGEDRGNIIINVRNLNVLDGSALITGIFPGSGSPEAQAEDIVINATDSVVFRGSIVNNDSIFFSGAFNQVGSDAEGDAGSILINTVFLTLSDSALISTSTLGKGDAGKVEINATEFVLFDGLSVDGFSNGIYSQVRPGAEGNAGGISINTRFLLVNNGAQVSASTFGQGNAGRVEITATDLIRFDGESINGFSSGANSFVSVEAIGDAGGVFIKADSLEVLNGAQINASTLGQGNAGRVEITATNLIKFGGESRDGFKSGIFSQINPGAEGNTRGIFISAGSLEVFNSAQINSSNFGKGNAGDILIQVDGSINFANNSSINSSIVSGGFGNGGDIKILGQSLTLTDESQINSSAFGLGNAGNIELEVIDNFRITNDSIIQASTANLGNGGAIFIRANNFAATNGGQLLTTTSSNGNAGDIKLNVTDRITISGIESGIFASTTESSTGNGGNINIDPKIVEIDGATISAASLGTGNPGNIDIQVDDILLLRRGAKISTLSDQDNDDQSNININTGLLIAVPQENSDISANAGGVTIFLNGILGIAPRDFPTELSDITSKFGVGNQKLKEIQFISGLIELPETIINPDTQVAQNACQQGIGSEFIATGRGGLPPNPTQDLTSSAVRVDLTKPVPRKITTSIPTASKPKSIPTKRKIVPAQGWIFNSKGQVVLTAYDPTKVGVYRTAQKALCGAT